MTTYVVDASVAAKWMIDEEHAESAASLRVRQNSLMAPDLVVPELGNVLRKVCLSGSLPIEIAHELARRLPPSDLVLISSAPLLPAALELALRYDRSVYDSLYVALAQREACQLVTADLRLYNALKGSLPERMLWIGDV